MQVGEYYIGGYVQRPGAYSLTAREVTLKQAIIAAGSLDPGLTNAFLSVERKESGRAFPLLRNASFQDLLSGKQPDVILRPNDEVMVSPSPIVESDATGGVSAPAPRWDHSDDPAMINLDMAIQHYEELRLRHDDAEIAKGADNPDVVILAKQEQKAYEVYLDAQQRATESHLNQQQNQGVYYIGGHVQRPGVYAVPGREITLKQAIIAAGSLDPDVDNDFLSVERRENGRVVSVLKNARYQDLLSGKQPDVSLHPNDTVVISKNPIKENGPTDGVPSTQK
jgi:protein involved in polysaccharide export with SLBB domain